jgi:hypothetical protein
MYARPQERNAARAAKATAQAEKGGDAGAAAAAVAKKVKAAAKGKVAGSDPIWAKTVAQILATIADATPAAKAEQAAGVTDGQSMKALEAAVTTLVATSLHAARAQARMARAQTAEGVGEEGRPSRATLPLPVHSSSPLVEASNLQAHGPWCR